MQAKFPLQRNPVSQKLTTRNSQPGTDRADSYRNGFYHTSSYQSRRQPIRASPARPAKWYPSSRLEFNSWLFNVISTCFSGERQKPILVLATSLLLLPFLPSSVLSHKLLQQFWPCGARVTALCLQTRQWPSVVRFQLLRIINTANQTPPA